MIKKIGIILITTLALAVNTYAASDGEILLKKKSEIEESIAKLNQNLRTQEKEFNTQKKHNEILRNKIENTNKLILSKKKIIYETKISNQKIKDNLTEITL